MATKNEGIGNPLKVQKVARGKGATDIPTARVNTQARATFQAPTLRDATGEILSSISKTANNYLNAKAEEAGATQGALDIEAGADIKEVEKKPNTIFGQAYKNTARTAFIAKTQTRFETQLTEAYNQNEYDVQGFKKEYDKIRSELAKTTPSNLQGSILQKYDATANKFITTVNTNAFTKAKKEDLLIVTDRLNLISDQAQELTLNGDPAGAADKMAEAINLIGDLVHVDKVWSAEEIDTWRSDTFGKLLAAEIKRDFEFNEDGSQRTFAEKEAFIKTLADGDYSKYITKLQDVYGEEIKKILPELTIPNDLNMSETADMLTNIESIWKEYRSEFQTERATVKGEWRIRQNDGAIISNAELQHAKNTYFMSDEELEEFQNANKVNEYVKDQTSGLETKTMSELQNELEKFQNNTEAGIANAAGGAPLDVSLGVIANNQVIAAIVKQMEKLDDVYQNFGKNGYEALGINIDADLRNIINAPTNTFVDAPPGMTSSPLYNLKKARAKAADILGVNEQDLPLVTTNQIAFITDQINSNDILQIDEALNTLTDIEANYNINMMNELELDPRLIVAMEMQRGTVERNNLLAAFVNNDLIENQWTEKSKALNNGETLNVTEQLIANNKKYQETVLNTGLDQQETADAFLVPVIKYMMLENKQDFATASENAMNMWINANDIIQFGEQTIYVNKSLANKINIEETQELIEDIYDNPMLYNYSCGEEAMTLTQCQENFAETTKLRLEGSTLYFVQIDEMYGTDGATILVNNPSQGMGTYQTPLQIELINGKKSLPYQDAQSPNALWTANPTIPNDIDTWKFVQKAPEGEKASMFDADVTKPGTQLFNPNPQKDKTIRLTLWEHKKKYVEIGAQTGMDPVALNIAEGGMTVADGMEGMNTGFGTIGENAMALTGISQNAIAKGKFSDREFAMLKDFDDFAELDDYKIKDQLQAYINKEWKNYIETGGMDGRWTGAKLSPLMTLHIIYQDALDSLEE